MRKFVSTVFDGGLALAVGGERRSYALPEHQARAVRRMERRVAVQARCLDLDGSGGFRVATRRALRRATGVGAVVGATISRHQAKRLVGAGLSWPEALGTTWVSRW